MHWPSKTSLMKSLKTRVGSSEAVTCFHAWIPGNVHTNRRKLVNDRSHLSKATQIISKCHRYALSYYCCAAAFNVEKYYHSSRSVKLASWACKLEDSLSTTGLMIVHICLMHYLQLCTRRRMDTAELCPPLCWQSSHRAVSTNRHKTCQTSWWDFWKVVPVVFFLTFEVKDHRCPRGYL